MPDSGEARAPGEVRVTLELNGGSVTVDVPVPATNREGLRVWTYDDVCAAIGQAAERAKEKWFSENWG